MNRMRDPSCLEAPNVSSSFFIMMRLGSEKRNAGRQRELTESEDVPTEEVLAGQKKRRWRLTSCVENLSRRSHHQTP